MDEANGPIFDHHDELFAQIGSADAEQALKDFVLQMTGSAGGSTSGNPGDVWGPCPPRGLDPNSYPLNNCGDGSLSNQALSQRGFFQPHDGMQYDMQCGAGQDATTNAFLDNLVKSLPDDMLDGINGLEAMKLPNPGSVLDTMHRISTDNGTQEYLDALSKIDVPDVKPPDHQAWNGAVDHYNFQSTPVSKAPTAPNALLRNIDRNGNCPTVYNNGIPDRSKQLSSLAMHNQVTKAALGFSTVDMLNHLSMNRPNPQLDALDILNRDLTHTKPCLPLNTTDILSRELTQNYLVKGQSPSVSADSAIHTPTTSYESTSPMSSGRTPLRSDDSISPLASCASPATSVRTPDCFSPGRVRRPDTSPMVRTPLRYEETPSPRAISRTPLHDVPSPAMRSSARNDDALSPAMRTSMRGDDTSPSVRMPASPAAPSPRAVARTPLRLEEAPSPRAVARTPLRMDEAPSPRAVARTPMRTDDALSPKGVSRNPLRMEDVPSPRAVSWTPLRADEVSSPRTPNRTPLRCDEAPSPRAPGRTPLRTDEALSPRGVARTPLRPEDTTSPRGVQRTPLRLEESPSPRSLGPGPSRPDDSMSPRVVSRTPTRSDVSPLPPRAPFSPGTVRRREGETATAPLDLQAGPAAVPAPSPSDSQSVASGSSSSRTASGDEPGHSGLPVTAKPRKRRKTDSLCVPTPKKRWNKKMPIYQSSVSGEESGIKLKIKLTAMPPPKRRRKRTVGDEVAEKGGKRRKRSPPSPGEQSPWGLTLPTPVLERIFRLVVDEEGCVPSLVRFSGVCRLWNSVAAKADLWQNVDLSSPCIKQKCKIDRYFRWLLENRMGALRDLNLNGWKFSNLPMVLSLIGTHCSDVENIGLSGWQGLHYEHLRSLLQDCPRLERIDLSDVSPESKSTNSAVSPKSITHLTETMAARLTELTLAHNTLSCLPQIITSLASNCPNLQVLDLSNIRRASHAEFALHVEELQVGCPRLRVLRITNSCITIAAVPFDQQAASPGFPALEELSIAGHQGTESLRITSVMDDDCLERIVKTSHKLRLLDVRGCTRITDSSLVRVPAWDIQHLFLSGCLVTRQSGSGLELIAQKWCHSLVEVDLGWASVTEDVNAAVLALADGGAESPLSVVNLCGSAVEPAPVKTLLTRCPQIESLNLQSCRGLPRGVKRLYERHQLPELLELLQHSSEPRDDG